MSREGCPLSKNESRGQPSRLIVRDLLGLQGANAADGFFGGLSGTEGGQAEVALAARAEAGTRGPDKLKRIEQHVEEFPRTAPIRGLQPDVRGVFSA